MIRKYLFVIANIFNRSKSLRIVLSITMALAIYMANLSHMVAAEIKLEEKKLFIYSGRELSTFLKNIGYQDFWYNDIRMSRNSDGTAIRFHNESEKKIFIVTCDGSMKVMDSPGPIAWLNDANQVKVWVTWADNKGVTHYANGMSEKTPFSPEHGPDSSGKYFIKERGDSPTVPLTESCYTSIFATENPDIPLAKVNVCGVTKIFYKDNKVFLTGCQYLDGSWQEEEIRIFVEIGNSLEQIDRVIVPRPVKSSTHFYAIDLNPWDDEMLYFDFHDMPVRSIWYTFNLRTHQLNKVRKDPWFGGRAFYLQCDIVKKIAEAKKTE